jgi:hypothetical protein
VLALLEMGYTGQKSAHLPIPYRQLLRQIRFQWRIHRKSAVPDSPVKTDRKAQNYPSEMLPRRM